MFTIAKDFTLNGSVTFEGGEHPQTFERGVSVILNQSNKYNHILMTGLLLRTHLNNIHVYGIAEAPFHLHRSERLKSLKGSFKISYNSPSVDYVQVHDANSEECSVAYYIDEVYESSKSVVAILLINTSDTMILDPHVLEQPNYIISIPVYVTSSVNGAAIIDHMKKAAAANNECNCEFTFESTESNNHEDCHRGIPSK